MIYKLSIEFDRKTALTTFRPEISKNFIQFISEFYYLVIVFLTLA